METIVINLLQYYPEENNEIIGMISCEILKIISNNMYNEIYDYYIKNNNHFADNVPDRYLYKNIIEYFKKSYPDISADETFYSFMDYLKSRFQ